MSSIFSQIGSVVKNAIDVAKSELQNNINVKAATNAPNSFSDTQTFEGSTSKVAVELRNATEKTTVVGSGATGTINIETATQSVILYTGNATSNWNINTKFSSSTTMNDALEVGQTISFTFMATMGATAYIATSFLIDDNNVTPKWLNGAPTAGGAIGIDVYSYTITKIASNNYSVLASMSTFK